MLAVAEIADKELCPNVLARGLATDGVPAVLAGFTTSFPDTAFAENVGLVGLTKISRRWVVTTCVGLPGHPRLRAQDGSAVAGIPGPVIGGGATVMFALVTAVGIRTLHKAFFEDNHNLLINRGVAVRWPNSCCGAAFLRQVPVGLPGHLRFQHHLNGDRGVRLEPGVQPLEAWTADGALARHCAALRRGCAR